MSAASADGGHGGRELSTDVAGLVAGQGEDDAPRRARPRAIDIVFFTFFAAFFAAAVFGVVLGIGSILAAGSAGLHETFHVRTLSGGFVGRMYERMADASHAMPSALLSWLSVAFSVLNLAIAVFLLWLRPRDRTARLLALGIVGTAAVFNVPAQTTIEIVGFSTLESWFHGGFHIVTGLAYTTALILFPDGRPIPRWRAPALILLYLPVFSAAVWLSLAVAGSDRARFLLLYFGLVIPIAGVLAQAYRFRTSDDPGEHQHARLLFWALLPALAIGVWFSTTGGLGSVLTLQGRLIERQQDIFVVFLPVFLLVPLVLFLGLIRYRLWDIDRVVNRTLVYGIATALPLGFYFLIVVFLQPLLRPLTGGEGLGVAISTLGAATVFFPVRRRVQDFVDRRFYRHRYDAQRTIEAFSARLRDQLDLEALAYELRGVVARTMQPTEITLLVRNPEGRLEWQWTYRGRERQDAP